MTLYLVLTFESLLSRSLRSVFTISAVTTHEQILPRVGILLTLTSNAHFLQTPLLKWMHCDAPRWGGFRGTR